MTKIQEFPRIQTFDAVGVDTRHNAIPETAIQISIPGKDATQISDLEKFNSLPQTGGFVVTPDHGFRPSIIEVPEVKPDFGIFIPAEFERVEAGDMMPGVVPAVVEEVYQVSDLPLVVTTIGYEPFSEN